MSARVVVVGGGVTGLTAAHRLLGTRPRPEVLVLDAGDRAGGKLASARVADLELEAGPDSFVARKPWAVELCRELGLGDGLEAPAASGTFLWTDHGLEPLPRTAMGIPADPSELVTWKGMSLGGRLRALQDLVRRAPRVVGDESIGSLCRRRLGDEATDVLVAPLLGGLHAGDVDRLGVAATFPELARWERDRGSLIRGAKAALGAAAGAGPMFLKPRDGTAALAEALAAAVGPERIRLRTRAIRVALDGDGVVVTTEREDLRSDAAVLAVPAYVASELLEDPAPASAAESAGIPYASTGVVLLAYGDGSAEALPDATGFVVPAGRAPLTAATFLSRKWPRPGYGSRAVIRCFVGGVGAEEVVDAGDEDVVAAVARYLAAALALPPRPAAASVVRWRQAMPQYEVGHLERVARVREGLPAGIVVAGAGFDGVGIPDCVRSAQRAADAVLEHLTGRPAGSDRQERVR
ncbi:MAG: protoporphyrinogen oxidase [Candidatus Velamenicoccus archaeovorus]